MLKLPKLYYSLALLICVVALAGCELSRDSSDLSDPGPVSEPPPTLAPLGAEIDEVAEADSVPVVIDAQTAAADSTVEEVQIADSMSEPVSNDGSAPVESTDASVITSNEAEQASSVVSETFVPPAEEASAEDIVIAQEAIVVDAPTNDLPTGGPVAANPPVSQTSGNYDSATFGDSTYTVQPGDTLYSIALRYGTTVEAIVYTNGLPSDFIYAGQELNIPAGDVNVPSYEQDSFQQPYQQPSFEQPYVPGPGDNYHVVASGETLYRIALQYGTSVDAIAGANGIPYPYFIQVGQQLTIPAPGSYAGPPPPPAGGFYQEQPYYQDGYQQQPSYQNDYQQAQPPSYDNYAPQDNSYSNPGSAGTHTVAPGETLYSIALRYGTSADVLAAANGLFNPNQIYVGQVLYLP